MVMAAYSSTDKKKTAGVSFEELVKEIKAGQFKPVYYLMGDESFYIDRLSDLLVETLLRPEERDFNLLIFFGAETDIDAVITAASLSDGGATPRDSRQRSSESSAPGTSGILFPPDAALLSTHLLPQKRHR